MNQDTGLRGAGEMRPVLQASRLSRDDKDQYIDEPIAWAYVLNLENIANVNQPLGEN